MKLLDYEHTLKFIKQSELETLELKINKQVVKLLTKTGKGNEFTGWVEYPNNIDKEEVKRIINISEKIKKDSKILVVIGIGGSYLGTKAAIDMLRNEKNDSGVEILFLGNSFSSSYAHNILKYLEDKDFSVNVVSKSGTTTESAVAFRLIKALMQKKYQEQYYKRVYATTTIGKGALYKLAVENKYEIFSIPEDIGGRYSVLTPVGLLPIAVAGVNIEDMIAGANDAFEKYINTEFLENDAMLYAAIRYLAYSKNKSIEILGLFEPSMQYFGEWYKQLFAESEGKEQKGLYPTVHHYSTDLHSIGQFVQDGPRLFLETIIDVLNPEKDLNVPILENDFDGLNYLTDNTLDMINRKALEATVIAHVNGGVPVVKINLPEINSYYFGYLAYFFMFSCAISGYLLDVNPFDQEGVEEYKKNMFALLGKPGYENIRKDIESKK